MTGEVAGWVVGEVMGRFGGWALVGEEELAMIFGWAEVDGLWAVMGTVEVVEEMVTEFGGLGIG